MNLLPDRIMTKKSGRSSTKVYMRTRTIENLRDAMRWSRDRTIKTPRLASITTDEHFCATKNINEYIDMFDKGWQAGVEDMQELEGITSDAADQLTFKRAPGGAFPVVPAYLSNSPDAMLMPTADTHENKRGITLVIDSCFSGSTRSTAILDYAKTIMRLVAWLKAERIEVAVYAVVPIRMDGKRAVYITPILEAGDVFQPERIASVLHPSFLRRAWFAMIEYEYLATDGAYPECSCMKYGYGSVTNVGIDELREALPEAYSVCLLPKPGTGDPKKAIDSVLNFKIRQGD